MDVQIKIKILKSFDHGLQKPFSKNKEEGTSQNIWLNEGSVLTNNKLHLGRSPLLHKTFWIKNHWIIGSQKFSQKKKI